MKRVLIGVMMVFVAAGSVMAQQASLSSLKEQRDQKIDAIEAPVRDIEARYWARLIKQGQMTYDEFAKNSRQTLGSDKAKKELLALIKQYVSSPEKIVITSEEMKKLDDSKRQVRMFLNGKENPAAQALARVNRQIREIEEPVFELDARYWAYRIAVVKDVTLDELKAYSENWVGERSYNQKLMEKVEENLRTGNTAKLSRKEEKKLDKAKQRVRLLLN